MAKIHWSVYIITGLFVSILSYKLNYEKLVFFFYIGLIFIVIGAAKLSFNLINKKAKKAQTAHHKPQQQAGFRYCPKCANVLRPHDKFCSICGAKV